MRVRNGLTLRRGGSATERSLGIARRALLNPEWRGSNAVRLKDLSRPRAAVVVTLLVGGIATALVAALAESRFALFRPSLYMAIETTASFAGMLAAYLVFF